MNLLALFLGLGIERLLTQVFHWREFHWLDPVFDLAFRKSRHSGFAAGLAIALGTAVLIVLPVAFLELSLQGQLAQIPLFIFAVIVLLFCLGPRDLGEEVDDFREAISKEDHEETQKLAAELLQTIPDPESLPDIEEGIYAQANNRIFAVVFWFALLGPTAAWLFRVLDLMRGCADVRQQPRRNLSLYACFLPLDLGGSFDPTANSYKLWHFKSTQIPCHGAHARSRRVFHCRPGRGCPSRCG